MKRVPARALITVGALALLALFVAACGSSDKAPAGSKELSYTLTEEGCSPTASNAPAGPIEFKVKNEGSSKYTELEVLDGETLLGEHENVTEGLSGSFALTLEEGEYTVRCQEAAGEGEGTLKVTGQLKTNKSPEIEKAISDYTDYILENSEELVQNTKPFVAAVIAGNIAEAKQIYPKPRVNYERIEPVAESFGNLDPEIDARENDVKPSEFGGFHRIEKALWEEENLSGMKPVAEGLLKNVEELESRREDPGGRDRQRRQRAPDRGLDLEDHRRGGALLAHRPGRLPGQRRRLPGGLGRRRAADEGPEAGEGNRRRLRSGLRGAEAV
jgi:iron uptake system component EfeO